MPSNAITFCAIHSSTALASIADRSCSAECSAPIITSWPPYDAPSLNTSSALLRSNSSRLSRVTATVCGTYRAIASRSSAVNSR